jgi:hypothetical protein
MKDLKNELKIFENVINSFCHSLVEYEIERSDKFTFETNLGLASKYNKFILKWLVGKVIPGAIVSINKEIRSHKLIIKYNDYYEIDTDKIEKYINPNYDYNEINDEIQIWLKKKVIEYFRMEDTMGKRASKIRFSSYIGSDIKDLKELISEYAPEFKGRFQIRN